MVMAVIKFAFPSFVTDLEIFWRSFVINAQGREWLLILYGFLIFAGTYWTVGLLFLLGPDLNHVPARVWKAKFQKKRNFAINGSPFNPGLGVTVRNALFNQLFVFLPGFFALHYGSRALGFGLSFSPELPSLWEVARTAVTLVAVVEVGFYYSHRLLHWPPLYVFHKVHHSFVTPIALSAIYSHPLEALLSSVLSICGPAFFLGTHVVLFYLASLLGWAVTCVSHSGYAGPLNRAAHDLHHSKNTGNFGLTGLLDYLHGTTIAGEQNDT